MKGRSRKASGGSSGSASSGGSSGRGGTPDWASQEAYGTSGIGRSDATPKKCGGRMPKKSGGCVRDDDKDAMACGGRLDRKPRKSGGSCGSPDGAKNTVASVGSPIAKK